MENCMVKICRRHNHGGYSTIKMFFPHNGGPSGVGFRLATFLREQEKHQEDVDVIPQTPPEQENMIAVAEDFIRFYRLFYPTTDSNLVDGSDTRIPARHLIDMRYKVIFDTANRVDRIQVTANRVDKTLFDATRATWDDDYAQELATRAMPVFGGTLREFARFVRVM